MTKPIFIYDRNENMRLVLHNLPGNFTNLSKTKQQQFIQTQLASSFIGPVGEQQEKESQSDRQNRGTIPYKDGKIEKKENGARLNFSPFADHPAVELIENEGRAVTTDEDGDFMEFIIRNIEDDFDGSGNFRAVETEGSEYELLDDWLEGYTESDVSFDTALKAILQGTRFEIGEVDNFNRNQSVDLKRMTVRKAVNKLFEQFNARMKYRVEVKGSRVVRRYIDAFDREKDEVIGRFEDGKDIISTKRTLNSEEIKTALYGYGESDEEGNRLTFGDIEWKRSDGDPVDKPKGDNFVGDPDALERWGRWGSDGEYKHKWGQYDGQEKDAATLLLNTWKDLQEKNEIKDTYETEVLYLGEITGYDHKKIRLGNKAQAVNHKMYPPLESIVTIIKYVYDLNDRNRSSVELGNFKNKIDTNRRLDAVEQEQNDNKGKFEKAPEKVKNELQKEIDNTLDKTQDRIDKAKEELEEAMDNIEVRRKDIEGLDDDLGELDDAIKDKVPIGHAAEDINDHNTKVLGKNLVVDGDATFIGDIGASGATFHEVRTKEMYSIDAIMENGIIIGTFSASDAKIKKAILEDVVVTGELNSPTGKFAGEVIAEEVKGSIISGVRLTTGEENDKYTKIEEEAITIVDNKNGDNLDKISLGYKDALFSDTSNPYLVMGVGSGDGTNLMEINKTESRFKMNYVLKNGSISELVFNNDGGVRLEANTTLHLDSHNHIEANNRIDAEGFKSNGKIELEHGHEIFQDAADNNRLKILASTGAGIYIDPNGTVRFVDSSGNPVHTFYDNGSVDHK